MLRFTPGMKIKSPDIRVYFIEITSQNQTSESEKAICFVRWWLTWCHLLASLTHPLLKRNFILTAEYKSTKYDAAARWIHRCSVSPTVGACGNNAWWYLTSSMYSRLPRVVVSQRTKKKRVGDTSHWKHTPFSILLYIQKKIIFNLVSTLSVHVMKDERCARFS